MIVSLRGWVNRIGWKKENQERTEIKLKHFCPSAWEKAPTSWEKGGSKENGWEQLGFRTLG